MNNNTKSRITFGGGCFWGVEAYFQRIKGVLDTSVGYANSKKENPSYEEVCNGITHAVEAVRISYDANTLSLETLIAQLFSIIDPYSSNRQGNDVGTQYRSGIYTSDTASYAKAKACLDSFKAVATNLAEGVSRQCAVELLEEENFYPAEEYHQSYLKKNPRGYCHIKLSSVPTHLLAE